ncbi:MAG: acetyltransferase [Marinobacter sp.]|uniref:acetyltransferase n=1 Tax=Marinobacter sp. TaxID=50741 RepID=UPI00299DC517|nr:acetyltransferase [Marinobacter sp.]MDX1757671.1 acetyltransferase [Marinobacter sp.]
MNDFLRREARNQMEKNINRTWVLVDEEARKEPPAHILGFFTLTNATVVRDELPIQQARSQYPAYPIPVIKLAWLGVDKTHQGTEYRVGETLLLEALEQAYRIVQYSGMGVAVVTDPLTPESDRFFRRYGFLEMARAFGDLQTLFMPMKTIGQVFAPI